MARGNRKRASLGDDFATPRLRVAHTNSLLTVALTLKYRPHQLLINCASRKSSRPAVVPPGGRNDWRVSRP